MTSEEPPPEPSAGRTLFVGSLLGFVAAVAVLGTAFAFASRDDIPRDGYLAYVLTPDAPVNVVMDPATEAQSPYTAATVIDAAIPLTLSLPGDSAQTLVLAAMDAAGLDPQTAQLMRITSTGSRADGSVNAYITLAMLTDQGYREFIGLGLDGSLLWNDPPITQLPADLAPGSQWQVEGLTNGFAPFTFTGEVLDTVQVDAPVGPVRDLAGCVDTRTRLDQQVPDAEGYAIERITTWCPGWATVASLDVDTGVLSRAALPDEVSWPDVTLPEPLLQPPGTQQAFPIGVAVISRPPLAMPGGLVVVNDVQGDLLSFTSGEPPSDGSEPISRVTWLQHPGGQVLGVSNAEDRIYVNSSDRALIAFDAAGRMRWTTTLPDAAVGSPVVLGDVVAVAAVDGTLRGFASSDGTSKWTVRLSDVITESPVVTSSAIIAGDSAGYMVSVGADGQTRWAANLSTIDAPLSPLQDGSVLVPQATGSLVLLDANGVEQWSVTPPDGKVVSPAVIWGDVLAVPTDSGVMGLSLSTGQSRWLLPDLTKAYLAPNGLLADRTTVARVAPDGGAQTLATIAETSGRDPQSLYVARLGDEWAAVTQEGLLTFLGPIDE